MFTTNVLNVESEQPALVVIFKETVCVPREENKVVGFCMVDVELLLNVQLQF